MRLDACTYVLRMYTALFWHEVFPGPTFYSYCSFVPYIGMVTILMNDYPMLKVGGLFLFRAAASSLSL